MKEKESITYTTALPLRSQQSTVNLLCRVAWAWRRNFCPMDSLVLISRSIGCSCNGEPPSNASTSTRFRLAEVLRAAGRLNNEDLVPMVCGRTASAQLELQVHVLERRRARHINGSEAGAPLGQIAYPVAYSTSTLPLFFAPGS